MKEYKENIDLANKLQVASDHNRLKILCLLFNNKSICVSDIAKALGQSIAITSHHLISLSKAGLVGHSRVGKKICYKLSDEIFAKDLKKFICKYK